VPARSDITQFEMTKRGRTEDPSLTRLLDLPTELLVAIVARLAEDDELAASLACRSCARLSRAPSDAQLERRCRRGSARRSTRWPS
jgi:hypothetical protein